MEKRDNTNYIIGRQKARQKKLMQPTGWRALAKEIVHQAVRDYKSKNTSFTQLRMLVEFFQSPWFNTLSDVDSSYALRKLNEYRRSHGYVIVGPAGNRDTDRGNTDSLGTVDTIRD